MKTMKTLGLVSMAVLGLLLAGSGVAQEILPTVAGVSGMTPVTGSSCVAIWIPVPANTALAGLMWYNNDELAVFPEILLESGTPDYPVALSAGRVVAQDVAGGSSAWSAVTFSEPVTCASSGLYVLMRLPEGSEQEDLGIGGGAGLGFVEGGGCEGWMTIDGAQWVRVRQAYGFAVEPVFVAAQSGMLQMMGAGMDPGIVLTGNPEALETALLPVAPNPFNPSTDVRFSLKDASRVQITVYDVRGAKVVDLVNEVFQAGQHAVTWEGRDGAGSRVASGVYFANLRVGGENFTRRMLLVK